MDEDEIRERAARIARERVARILQEVRDGTHTEQPADEKRPQQPADEKPQPDRPVRTAAFVALWALVTGLLVMTALTLDRYTRPGMADAYPTGTATVEKCDRRGPVGAEGFGYWYACVAAIRWEDQQVEIVRPAEPGLFTPADIGTPVPVGVAEGRLTRAGTDPSSAAGLTGYALIAAAVCTGWPLVFVVPWAFVNLVRRR